MIIKKKKKSEESPTSSKFSRNVNLDINEFNKKFEYIQKTLIEKTHEEEMNYKKIFHCIKLCDFLTHEEVEMVQSYMDEERLPQPKGWSNALWLGFSRDVIKNFNLDKPYNVEELEDLKMTLEDMNFPYKEIFWKIDSTIYKTKTKRKSEEKE